MLGFTKFPAGRFGGPEPASMLGAAPETDRSHTPPTPIGFSLDQSPIRNELDLFLPWSSLYRCRSVPQLLEAGNTTQPKTKLTPPTTTLHTLDTLGASPPANIPYKTSGSIVLLAGGFRSPVEVKPFIG